ncbi:MAG: D-alanine--D-alanine ligase [bacterium]|nr:D-alanine--D-alanine ligase [bacterium]
MIKLGVIFGGESVEHEVSIISAVQAMNKMDNEKYEVIPIYISKEKDWYTGDALKDIETYSDMSLLKRYCKKVVLLRRKGRFILQNQGFFKREINELDLAFPIVHGTSVEDGTLQGYLKTIGIPFVGSDVLASAISQDKIVQKQVFASVDLPMTDYIWFYDTEYIDNSDEILKKAKKIGYPVIVKPASLGSSVGIKSAHNEEELIKAIDEAITYDNKIIVEEMVENLTEVNISVLGSYDDQELSVIEEVMSDNDLLTFEDKYLGESKKSGPSKGMASASRKIPADLTEKQTKQVREIAISAFKALGSCGNVRIDFLINKKTKKIYINEINSCPGSLAFYLWEPLNIDYTELLDRMINIAIKEYRKKKTKIYSFESNILEGFSGAKGLKGLKK